jgi:hypothetical protein
VNVDDRENFKKNFEQSIRDNSDMQSYVRMQAKPEAPSPTSSTSTPGATPRATEALFEVNGYPHFIEGDDSRKCFFATAKTYPSRNTAMAEHVPRAEDGEPAVTTSHARTQGTKGTTHADPFSLDGSRVVGVNPPIHFRKQSVTRYVIPPSATPGPATCRFAATNGSRSRRVFGDKPQSLYAELRRRWFPGGPR